MSIQTMRTLSQLKQECQALNLDVKIAGKKERKDDYILALRDYHLTHDFPNGIPKALELILQIESPMLCQQYKILKPEEQNAIWESKNWYLEVKEDGVRMPLFHVEDNQFDFFSRNVSVTNYLPISYRDNIYTDNIDFSKIKDKFIVDCEVISTNPNINTLMANKYGTVTETQLQAVTALLALESSESIKIQKEMGSPLQFKAFDCIWWNGEWIMDKPLIERRKYLKEAIKQLKDAGLDVRTPSSNISNKKAFYKYVISNGGEGCVAKNLYSPYIATSSRRRDGFVKIKRTMSETMAMEGLADSVDGWISGFEPADENKSWKGLVGALEISLNLRDKDGNLREHKIARVANIPMSMRQEMTELDSEGNPILKQEYYGKVVTVDGQAVSAREKRLKHAILIGFRPDRSMDTCIMDEEFLNSMIL